MARKHRKNVGVIGLGIIGSRAAAVLRTAGFAVYVWNRTPKPAPNFLGSPAEVAAASDIIQLFVADAPALFEVIGAMSPALTPQHVIICSATVGPDATLKAAKLVAERGAQFLDAPFTGSKAASERGELVYYLGGSDATVLRAEPMLKATSKAIVRIGSVGQAAIIKVVTNMIAAVSIQTLAEALAIVQKSGLLPEVLGTALEHNACRSGTMELKLPKMLQGEYEPHFSLKHMFKDVQLGVHLAKALDLEIPATTVTAGVMYGALNRGCAELDFSAVFKAYEGALPPPPSTKPAASAEELTPEQRDVALAKDNAPESFSTTVAGSRGDASEKHATIDVEVSVAPKAEGNLEAAASRPNLVRRWFVSRSGS